MAHRRDRTASKQLKLPLFGAAAALMLALPTAGLALVTLGSGAGEKDNGALDLFTPASVDPDLAARVATKAREKGLRFTPASSNPALRDRTVTVAVRVDRVGNETAKAVSAGKTIEAVPGKGQGIAALKTSKFNLGIARGYQSFARAVQLPSSVRDLKMPDLSEFEPIQPSAEDKPSRLKPRIALEGEKLAGRSPNTLDALASQTVDVGGSFSISSKVDVTAGVRLRQERERLDPLTNSVQDSQAVYVGTQIKF